MMIATFSLISYLSTAQVFRDYAMLAEIKKVNYARIAGRGTETGLCAADYDETRGPIFVCHTLPLS